MAQTSSAAREPSMEEILASIRRIIEDSDVTRQPAPVSASAPARGEVAEFRRPVTEQPVAQPEKPSMMRNVFQDEPTLRGPIEPVPAMHEPEIEADDEDEIVLNAENDDHSDLEDSASSQQPDGLDISLEEMDLSVEAGIAQAVDTLLEPETEAETAPDVPVQPEAAASVAEAVAKPQPAAHMLSQMAERQVAAAFQDLNHVVRAEPRRSFDDIAAELLRPMLQDWLDNNLPTLVERLVREEIERVVRGDR
ncbi:MULTISPECIES: PopZ family protein [unclassified Ochrobactrum]|uniref:PopZ family protein n=1 Tax=unclassified Ochrobactrum TaxID=239106 RepID=UPI000DEEC973|nr:MULTISPECIES: PopZ family protein [unclassified Ochrobactrum]MBQ0708269.1 PopZ family protein [Ochrobactrum sp. AP1BH01-1]